jgi:hypothetical protein
MWHRLFALGCALVIGGCQASPPPASTEPITHKTVAHPGDAAVSAVGTPSYLVFKSVFCAASVAIAAPVGNCSFKRGPLRFGGATRPGRRGQSELRAAIRAQPFSDSVGKHGTGDIGRPGSIEGRHHPQHPNRQRLPRPNSCLRHRLEASAARARHTLRSRLLLTLDQLDHASGPPARSDLSPGASS